MIKDERYAVCVDLLTQLVRVPSVNPPGLEEKAVRVCTEFLKKHGVSYFTVEVAPGREDVVAIKRGTQPNLPGIIFTGHLDVVPVSEKEYARWICDPFAAQIRDGRLYGRGATDMKSGVAALLTALVFSTPVRDVAAVLTVDEEDAMAGSKALVGHPALSRFTEVVVCEPTDMRLCTKGRGRTYGHITVTGQTGHGSRPGVSLSAIKMARYLMDEMDRVELNPGKSEGDDRTFWQILAIHAGVEPCVVPDSVKMTLDARLALDDKPERIWSQLRAVIADLKQKYPSFGAEIDVIDCREPWETDANSPLIKRLDHLLPGHDRLCFTGTTDGTILRRDGRDVVIIGPGNLDLAHKENESVSLEALRQALVLYGALMNLE